MKLLRSAVYRWERIADRMWNVYAFLFTFAICTGYALIRGGPPERLVAITLFIAAAVTATVAAGERPFHDRELGIMVVDLALFGAVLTVAMRAERFWPLWMAALLGFGVLLQGAYLAAPVAHRNIYHTLSVLNVWPTQILLAVATYRHRKRLTANGRDKAWSSF